LVFNALGVGTVFLGGIIAYLIHLFASVKIENAVGLMSGSVTNTPGLGAAKSTLIEIQKQFNLTENQFSNPVIGSIIIAPIGLELFLIRFLVTAKHLSSSALFSRS